MVKIYDYETGEELREATEDEYGDYLQMTIDDRFDSGYVDGRTYGYDRPITMGE